MTDWSALTMGAIDFSQLGAAQIVSIALACVALLISGFVSGSEIAYFFDHAAAG